MILVVDSNIVFSALLNPSSEVSMVKDIIYNSIEFISEDLISRTNWEKAFELTKPVDEKDTPFIALALELNTKLWSGDKKLSAGIKYKNKQLIIQTNEVLRLK